MNYGCKARTLTSRDEQHIKIFKCRILRRFFGPVQNGDGSCRIRMKYELKEPIENAYVVGFTKSIRIAWVGHVMQMDDKRTPKKF